MRGVERLASLLAGGLLAGCLTAAPQNSGCGRDADCPGGLCVAGTCRDACNADVDCGAARICQRGVCVTDVSVTLQVVGSAWLSSAGVGTTEVSGAVGAPGRYRWVLGSDCFVGTSLTGGDEPQSAASGASVQLELTVAQLRSGTNEVRLCLTTEEGDYDAAVVLHRDDTPPITSATPGPGVYVDALAVALSCGDNPAAIAYSLLPVDPVFGPDGAVLVGELYSAPVPLDSSSELRVRCLDQAGNVEAARRLSFSLVPVLDVELTGSPVVSNDLGLVQETTFSLHSSLSGSFAVMTEGSCERGAPYAGFGGTGAIAAGVPEEISIAASALPNGPESFNLRFCVTETGGGTNSVLYGLAIDNEPPYLSNSGGGAVCLPEAFDLYCNGCLGVAWDLGGAPTFDSAGALLTGTPLTQVNYWGFYLPVSDFVTSGSADVYFVAWDDALNFTAPLVVSLQVTGATPTVEVAGEGTAWLSGVNQPQTSVSWTAPAGLSFTLRDGDCNGPVATLAVGPSSGVTAADNLTVLSAADVTAPGPNDYEWRDVAIRVVDPGGNCPSEAGVILERIDAYPIPPGYGNDLSTQPASIRSAMERLGSGSIAASSTITFEVADGAGWHAVPNGGGTAIGWLNPYYFGFDLEVYALPENTDFRLTFVLEGDARDRANNPVAGTYTSGGHTYAVEEAHPLLREFTVGAEVIEDTGARLTWYQCSLGQGAGCSGAADEVDWFTAITACEVLNSAAAAGRTDWRLPRYAELLTLVDWDAAGPPWADPVFAGALAVRHWAATSGGFYGSGLALSVDFAGLAHGPVALGETHAVRCVAGAEPDQRIQVGHSGGTWDADGELVYPGPVLFDTLRQRGWDPAAPGPPLTFSAAEDVCATLASARYGGSAGWRVPRAAELYTLLRLPWYVIAGPEGVDPDESRPYWTTEPAPDGAHRAIDFFLGDSLSLAPAETAYVRCVTLPPVP